MLLLLHLCGNMFHLNIHQIIHVDIYSKHIHENMHFEIINKSNAIFNLNLSKDFKKIYSLQVV